VAGVRAVLPSRRDVLGPNGCLGGREYARGVHRLDEGLLTLLPDGRAEIRSFAIDAARDKALVYAVFTGTHTGDGGPVPPTRKHAEADYVCDMDFNGDKVRRMTKIWNDTVTLQQLGWA
jgi:hypothetical protein